MVGGWLVKLLELGRVCWGAACVRGRHLACRAAVTQPAWRLAVQAGS